MSEPTRSGGGTEPTVVAVVDDDSLQRKVRRAWLAAAGYAVIEFSDGGSAARAGAGDASALFLDLGDLTGLEVLAAMRLGAFDYLAEPRQPRTCARRAIKAAGEHRQGREAPGDRPDHALPAPRRARRPPTKP